jgi:multidrug resistance efflux pump
VQDIRTIEQSNILPDYLYRRYRQEKRFGREITFFSVWFELRWGITACLMLTVALITVIFYYHPSTTTATLYFRTLPILPEINGRVSEVHVEFSAPAKKGEVIFKLDSAKQEAALETAQRKVAEVDADLLAAQADVLKADAQIQQAKSDYQQASDELDVKRDLQKRSPGIVPQRDIEKLEVLLAGRQSALDSATASKQSVTTRLTAVLPAEKGSAQAALAEAQVDLDKTSIKAGGQPGFRGLDNFLLLVFNSQRSTPRRYHEKHSVRFIRLSCNSDDGARDRTGQSDDKRRNGSPWDAP